jgi:hypothetical protein
MNSSLSFNPVQGAESKIKSHGVQDGNLYFATDTGKMFLDANGKRISVGGAGAAIYYAKGQVIEHPKGYWIISKADMVNALDSPSLNDIILNVDDGTFYKVEVVTQVEYQCSRLSISGGANNGTAPASQPSLQFVGEFGDNNVINGSKVGIWFVANSALGQDGLPLNNKLTI